MIHHTSGDQFAEIQEQDYGQQYTLGSDDGIGPSDKPRGFSDNINEITIEEQKGSKWGFGGLFGKKKEEVKLDQGFDGSQALFGDLAADQIKDYNYGLNNDPFNSQSTAQSVRTVDEIYKEKEESRKFIHLFKCKHKIWRQYLKQNNRGYKCLISMLIVQVIYAIIYFIFNAFLIEGNLNYYEVFDISIIFWMIVSCFYFLRNAVKKYMIEELKIFLIAMIILNAYETLRWSISIVDLYEVRGFDIIQRKNKSQTVLTIQFIMECIGLGLNLIIFVIMTICTYFIYQNMRLFILHHLDNNRQLWDNFLKITMIRGILKLDIFANIEYFCCFTFILFNDEIEFNQGVWIFMTVLFVVSILTQFYGQYGAINSASKWAYRMYFSLRMVVEVFKLIIVIMIPAFNLFLWQEIQLEQDHTTTHYYEFLAFVIMSCIFTFFTTIWSTIRIYDAWKNRVRTQSTQIKAKWRVDESHFNRNVSEGTALNSDDAKILKRILASMD